jgi:hypothetical protein
MFSQEQAPVSMYLFQLPVGIFCVFCIHHVETLEVLAAAYPMRSAGPACGWTLRVKRLKVARPQGFPEAKVGDVVDPKPVTHPGNQFFRNACVSANNAATMHVRAAPAAGGMPAASQCDIGVIP